MGTIFWTVEHASDVQFLTVCDRLATGDVRQESSGSHLHIGSCQPANDRSDQPGIGPLRSIETTKRLGTASILSGTKRRRFCFAFGGKRTKRKETLLVAPSPDGSKLALNSRSVSRKDLHCKVRPTPHRN